MKKNSILLALIGLFISISYQSFGQYYFYVGVTKEDCKPIQNSKGGEIWTNNEQLNILLKEYDVKDYYQPFPGLKDSIFRTCFVIHFYNDSNAVEIDYIEQRFRQCGCFDTIYREKKSGQLEDNPVSIEDGFKNEQNKVSVYPNPFHESFFVTVEEEGKLFVSDILGKQLHSFSLQEGENGITLNTLCQGFYIFTVKTKSNQYKHFKIYKR